MTDTQDVLPKGTVLLTGANSGLGAAFAERMLDLTSDAYFLFPVRNPADKSCQKLAERVKSRGAVSQLDLSSLANVRAFAQDINAQVASGQIPRLRTVFLNAATMQLKGLQYGADGYEKAFTVNYMANFLLTLLLLQSMDHEVGRIVLVSSSAADAKPYLSKTYDVPEEHFVEPELAAKPVAGKTKEGFGDGMRRYGLSKLMSLMFMYELQRRLDRDPKLNNISILTFYPGSGPGTKIMRSFGEPANTIFAITAPLANIYANHINKTGYLRTIPRIADDMLFIAFNETTLGEHPKALFVDGKTPREPGPEGKDEGKQKRLWEGSLSLAGLKDGETMLQDWQ
jgi:NAD(P)-dependent dehydrogenase (short-subunit alcohol dehydrogenase family)